jgi:hypothetical protein
LLSEKQGFVENTCFFSMLTEESQQFALCENTQTGPDVRSPQQKEYILQVFESSVYEFGLSVSKLDVCVLHMYLKSRCLCLWTYRPWGGWGFFFNISFCPPGRVFASGGEL